MTSVGNLGGPGTEKLQTKILPPKPRDDGDGDIDVQAESRSAQAKEQIGKGKTLDISA